MGLRVSLVGLGTMTWGRDTDEVEAKEQLDVFLDAGGTLPLACLSAFAAALLMQGSNCKP